MFFIKEVLAIIPARGGSKGLSRKNIRELNGKPLICYTIEAAKQSNYISRTMVSTDDMEIANIALRYGAEVPFIRPKALAEDDSKSIDVVSHALNWYQHHENHIPDIVIFLQPTSPLRNSRHIDEAMEAFLRFNGNSVISVCEFEHSPYWGSKIENDRVVPLLNMDYLGERRQELPRVYRYNGAIYISSVENLLKHNTFFIDVRPYIMGQDVSIDIDTWLDFHAAEIILKTKGVEE